MRRQNQQPGRACHVQTWKMSQVYLHHLLSEALKGGHFSNQPTMSQITLKMCFTEDCTCLTGQHAGPALIPGTRCELKISFFKSVQYHIFLHNHDLCFFSYSSSQTCSQFLKACALAQEALDQKDRMRKRKEERKSSRRYCPHPECRCT